MSQYNDRTLACRDCGGSFVYTAGEQEFYSSRGFNEPTRCPSCRAARKAARDGGSEFGRSDYGGHSDYGGGGGGGRGRSEYGGGGGGRGRSEYGGGGGGARQMFKVVCADCNRETEVPFEPRSGRPVYCRDCFEKRNPRR